VKRRYKLKNQQKNQPKNQPKNTNNKGEGKNTGPTVPNENQEKKEEFDKDVKETEDLLYFYIDLYPINIKYKL
jgi:hypothetical protein